MSSASHIPFFKSEFQLNFLRLSIPLRATAFKFATSDPTAFDSATCDRFQVCCVQQRSILLRATAFKLATPNSFRFRYVRQLSSSLGPTAFKLFFQCMNHSLIIISVLTKDRLFSGLPDCMHKLAKLLTMLFVFHLHFVFFVFVTALMMVWLNYSRNLATLVVLPPREFVRSLYTSRSLTMHIQFILLMTLKFS